MNSILRGGIGEEKGKLRMTFGFLAIQLDGADPY